MSGMDSHNSAGSADVVRLEWCYDIRRPLLAHADLLSARPSYSTALTTEDGTFPATVLLPRSFDTNNTAISDFLAPPHGWVPTRPSPDKEWGTYHRSGPFQGVVIKRLAFTIETDLKDVKEGLRGEWEALLALEIRHNMDSWWENVRTWLEISTNQRLAQVGHEEGFWLDTYSNTSVWTVADDGTRQPMPIGGTGVPEPDKVLAVTPETLQDCLELATTTPPLAWTLLRDARALQRAGQHRRAVIDAAIAAELAVTQLIDQQLQNTDEDKRENLLKSHKTLGGKTTLLKELGAPLPDPFKAELIDRRNKVLHEGENITAKQSAEAFMQAVPVVSKAFPLPTAQASGRTLACLWSSPVDSEPAITTWGTS
ncbi:hypothetical protein [Mycolicibacterium goodii]|uniref:hypothetical protein n=1 Tax=Mycolicibacterium goodii TaxID=134601 RepID=UPI001BDD8811|nr:hypothetical protein [Mycolicibacterium goodii]MBU8841238.1 hypothetical protein [Mycolicibacterium goodii]